MAGAEAVSGVQLVDPLFTGFDEGINGGPIAAGHGSEDGSVNDPFVGFGGGGGVEGGKVFQRLFEFGFGLGGVAIFLCGRVPYRWPLAPQGQLFKFATEPPRRPWCLPLDMCLQIKEFFFSSSVAFFVACVFSPSVRAIFI
jgi:hypothetical protein